MKMGFSAARCREVGEAPRGSFVDVFIKKSVNSHSPVLLYNTSKRAYTETEDRLFTIVVQQDVPH